MQIAFLLTDEPQIESLLDIDPDRDGHAFQRGERIWILQTYLRLAGAGYPVRLTSQLPDEGLVLYHVKHRNDLMRQWRPSCRAVLVGIRADNHHNPIADFEVLQNTRYVRPGKCFYVPHWPQPGILPRDSSRGASIRRITYRGFNNNLAAGFLAPPFQDWLAAQGIEWSFDSVEFAGRKTDEKSVAWHDYRQADLVLAVRPPSSNLHVRKPATKLYNAWFGEAPALLGPEYAYRSLRRSPLDYIEVSTPEQARQAIETLRADPQLYLAMVANGRTRAAEYTAERILQHWIELLYTTLPALVDQPRVRRWRGRSLEFKKFVRRFLPFEDP